MDKKAIQRGLEHDARLVEERIPMAQKSKKLAAKLAEFMAQQEYSQRKIAKMIGVSPAVISLYLKGKYKGNLGDINNKVVHLINSITRREKRVKNKPFIDTTVAKAIGTLITQTEAFGDEEGKIGLVIGDGGHGKSHCMRQYAEANKNTIYVELDDAMTSTLIFAEIAKMLGIDSSGSLAIVTRRLIENLQNRHIIVMLDEASSLSVKQLNQLRQIIVVKARCPLILAGNKHLLSTVMQPTTRRGFESLDQFTSRLMGILDLDKIATDKGGGLYTADDIRKLYEYGGVRLASGAVKTLQKIARTPRSGRLRTCSHIIAALHTSHVVDERGVIDSELIIAAIEQLDLPVKVYLPMAAGMSDEPPEEQAVAKAG